MEDILVDKISAFIATDPALWFKMAESTFELAVPQSITDERTKYNYCVSHSSPDSAMAVRDDSGESKSQEIRTILSGEQLGDRKPSVISCDAAELRIA
ncbi:hypothetical protein AVEN_177742-1 [Araneus ventricosus]|uniref:DUF7041 domain-containing protein n=1 Tax=Araneus ventricosus TaxID=182803 RepID=A0A4Y2I7M0_ARAVE|nr:hypothetical protein AVEN_177742-1 [Araneus ventricosus]